MVPVWVLHGAILNCCEPSPASKRSAFYDRGKTGRPDCERCKNTIVFLDSFYEGYGNDSGKKGPFALKRYKSFSELRLNSSNHRFHGYQLKPGQ